MKKDNIPDSLLDQVESELLSGEELLWVGLPGWRHLPAALRSEPTVSALVGGMLAVAVAALTFMSLRGAVTIVMLVALLAVLLGVTIAAARLNRMLVAKKQVYAITNRRAVIVDGNRVVSFGREDIEFIQREMHKDGTGDILFKHIPQDFMTTGYGMSATRQAANGFFGVDNPVQVEALMLETFRSTGQHSRLEAVPPEETAADPEAMERGRSGLTR